MRLQNRQERAREKLSQLRRIGRARTLDRVASAEDNRGNKAASTSLLVGGRHSCEIGRNTVPLITTRRTSELGIDVRSRRTPSFLVTQTLQLRWLIALPHSLADGSKDERSVIRVWTY